MISEDVVKYFEYVKLGHASIGQYLHDVILKLFYSIDCYAEQGHSIWSFHTAKRIPTSKAHGFNEAFLLANLILSDFMEKDKDGAVVEMGCYTGISTAKMSILSRLMSKKMYAFDSFCGLPDPDEYGTDAHKAVYQKGDYFSDLELVKNNVNNYGFGDNVEYVQGWFSDTLPNRTEPSSISYCFIDVDLIKSLQECLTFVYDRVSPGGIVICHEARDAEMAKMFKDTMTAKNEFDVSGAGSGIDCMDEKTNIMYAKRKI